MLMVFVWPAYSKFLVPQLTTWPVNQDVPGAVTTSSIHGLHQCWASE